MPKKKVLVTGIVPKEGLVKLMEKYDVTYSDGEPFSRDYVLNGAKRGQGNDRCGEKLANHLS